MGAIVLTVAKERTGRDIVPSWVDSAPENAKQFLTKKGEDFSNYQDFEDSLFHVFNFGLDKYPLALFDRYIPDEIIGNKEKIARFLAKKTADHNWSKRDGKVHSETRRLYDIFTDTVRSATSLDYSYILGKPK
jgi:hypothetical protein